MAAGVLPHRASDARSALDRDECVTTNNHLRDVTPLQASRFVRTGTSRSGSKVTNAATWDCRGAERAPRFDVCSTDARRQVPPLCPKDSLEMPREGAPSATAAWSVLEQLGIDCG